MGNRNAFGYSLPPHSGFLRIAGARVRQDRRDMVSSRHGSRVCRTVGLFDLGRLAAREMAERKALILFFPWQDSTSP